jgi:outer membrane protein OmpA-like peptidoglycan-associated protein
MRILITGFAIFVIWCFFSAWLYNDEALPALKNPVTMQTIPKSQTTEADSLMKLKASMPANLLIYFEFNDAKFKADPLTSNIIEPFKAWLERYSGSMISVTGNTDLVGTTEYNKALGLRRALAVEKYLETMGINSGRIITESKGESNPAADYLTEEGRAKNRRTEISLKMQ